MSEQANSISSSPKQEEIWLSFLRYGLVPPQFPREMLWSRLKVRSEKQYLDVLRQCWRGDSFCSVYTDWQRRNGVIDTIFLENDYDNLEDANKDHEKLMTHFNMLGIWARRNFSGRRSYHYYIDIPPTKLDFPGDALRNWATSLPIRFDCVIEGNISSLARVPGTLHPETGLFCIPINSPIEMGATISLENVKIQEVVPNIGLANILKGIPPPKPSKRENKIISGGVGGFTIPPCIISIINFTKNTGECGHAQRIHLGTYLMKVYGKETALGFFKELCTDFKLSSTSYQLSWLEKHKWNCYRCSRAKEMGICPLPEDEVCKFYPSINAYI